MILNISNIITGLWITIYNLVIIKLFFSNLNSKHDKIISIFFFGFLHALNLSYTNSIIQIILHLLLVILFSFYEKPDKKEEVIYLIEIIYFIRSLFEVLFNLSLYTLKISFPSLNTLIIMTSTLTLLFILTFKNYINYLISQRKISGNKDIQNIIILNIYVILILIIKIPNYTFLINGDNILLLLIIFTIFNLSFILLREKVKCKNYIDSYNQIIEYFNTTENLLTKYKTNLHESRNQLIIIQSLAKNNEELYNYISLILEEKENNEYTWVNDIKNIPIQGIKGLINYKIQKMKELNINTEIYVSENININNQSLSLEDKNDLYTIIGIYLDNAIEASLESKEKMIALNVYEENHELIFLIANTFKDINLEHIYDKGYSTKSPNRGIGLYIVDSIINKNSKLAKFTGIKENFFIQKINFKAK